jgi:hypothetical protein
VEDAPFCVTHATWLATESTRLQAIILSPRFWGEKWTHKRLRAALQDSGLAYSLAQIAELNDDLHKRRIVEDVEEATPAPVEIGDAV